MENGGTSITTDLPSACSISDGKEFANKWTRCLFLMYGGLMDRVGISLMPAIQKVNDHQLNILSSSQNYWGKPEQAPHALA